MFAPGIRSSVFIVGALLSTAVIVSAGVDQLRVERLDKRAETVRGLQNLALSLERDIGLEVRAVGTALGGRLPSAARTPLASPEADAVRPVDVIDADGIGGVPGVHDYRDEPFFKALRDGPPGSAEVVAVSADRKLPFDAGLVVAKRLQQHDGRFAGAVAGLVAQSRIVKLLANYDLGRGGYASLALDDGRLLAAVPDQAGAASQAVASALPSRDVLRNAAGVFETAVAATGGQRVNIVRKLDGLPLLLVLSMPYEDLHFPPGPVNAALALAAVTLMGVAAAWYRIARGGPKWRLAGQHDYRPPPPQNGAASIMLQAWSEHLSSGLLVVGCQAAADYTLEYANDKARGILGMLPGVAGRKLSGALANDRWAEIYTALGCCGAGAGPLHRQIVSYENSVKQTVSLTVSAIQHDGDTNGRTLLATVEDTTQSSGDPGAWQDGVERVTSGIANEFNNLLQIIIGHLELVQGGPAEHHARAAMDAALRGARLTSGLLSFSSKQSLRAEPVAPGPLLDRVRSVFDSAGDGKTALVTEVAPDTPDAFVDAAQLETALSNLCLNGHEAMLPAGGVLTVRVSAADRLPAAGAGGASRFVVFAVVDSGHGMDDQVAAQAREPFFTTRGTRMRLGMGLPMADGFARQSGGELRLRSSAGSGTTVELWLPAVMAEPAPLCRAPIALQRVLLVEDNPDLLELFAEVLADAGFQVTKATDAEQALTWLRGTIRFDLLVTDYIMTGLNGLQLIDLARGLQPAAKALLVTGDAEDTRLAPAGSISVLRKPFRADQLISQARLLTVDAAKT